MSKTTDYIIDKEIDLTDPNELSLDDIQDMLNDDPDYQKFLDAIDYNRDAAGEYVIDEPEEL